MNKINEARKSWVLLELRLALRNARNEVSMHDVVKEIMEVYFVTDIVQMIEKMQENENVQRAIERMEHPCIEGELSINDIPDNL